MNKILLFFLNNKSDWIHISEYKPEVIDLTNDGSNDRLELIDLTLNDEEMGTCDEETVTCVNRSF